jgi:hypothetical protein
MVLMRYLAVPFVLALRPILGLILEEGWAKPFFNAIGITASNS